MGLVALNSLDYYKGELNVEYYSLLRILENIECALRLAESSAGVDCNTFSSQDFGDLAYDFFIKLRGIAEKVDGYKLEQEVCHE